MTDPGRYDRPDPCEHCGQPHRGDCPPNDDWDEWHDDLWAGVDPADYGLRAVRDLRTEGEVL